MITKKQIITKSLVLLGIIFSIFTLILLTSNKIYALGFEVPDMLIVIGIVLGVIGIPLYVIDKNPFRYVILSPPLLLFLLFLLRSDPFN